MADETVSGAALGAIPAPAKRAPFFQLNASYVIADDATTTGLFDDFECLFESGVGCFETENAALEHHEWAGLYMLRQAKAVFDEIRRRASADTRSEGGAA